jgi:hypothetical protein
MLPWTNAPLGPDLDFLAVAVREGFLDFVAPTLDELEKSSATGSLHAAYKSHLVIASCEGASCQLIEHRIYMAEYLLRRWSSAGLGHWGIYFHESLERGFMEPWTPIMAVSSLAFVAPHLSFAWKSLECMLRHGQGGTLGDLTTVRLVEHCQPKTMNMDARPEPDNWDFEPHALVVNREMLPGKRYILLEANMSFVLGLHQTGIQGRINDRTAQKACNLTATEIARHQVAKRAKVLLVCNGDPASLYRPASEADSSYLLEPFLDTTMGRRLFAFCIPGLGDRVREVAKRGVLYRRDELRADLENRGLIVSNENVKDWPPKPFGC